MLLQRIKDYVLNDLRDRNTLKLNVSIEREGEEFVWFDIDGTLLFGVYCDDEIIDVQIVSSELVEYGYDSKIEDHDEEYHFKRIVHQANYWYDFVLTHKKFFVI